LSHSLFLAFSLSLSYSLFLAFFFFLVSLSCFLSLIVSLSCFLFLSHCPPSHHEEVLCIMSFHRISPSSF
jgi:hypothetical protein